MGDEPFATLPNIPIIQSGWFFVQHPKFSQTKTPLTSVTVLIPFNLSSPV